MVSGPPDTASPEPGFPVVGIGASAGGLDALKKLFSSMRTDCGMAFVLVPHLAPTHESLMVELLAKQTEMPVCEVQEGMVIEPNRLYVIPPDKDMSIGDRVLHLSKPPEPRGLQTAIDSFFRSLAEDVRELAIGIILSGTGAHGTLGLQAIKGHGGMVMVQEPDTAQYEGMPQSAIATGLADYILPVEEMPVALVKYVQHSYQNGAWKPATQVATDADQLNRILGLLRARTKYDFRCYRKQMLMRRVHRRMGLRHVDTVSEYLDLLRDNADEVKALFHDLLIGVTGFFREPEAYKVLQQQVIAPLVERVGQEWNVPSEKDGESGRLAAGPADRLIRVWVPGCATGEEAYSIAMLLIEQLSAAQKPPNVQVFATDIDEQALDFARQGIYPESVAADITPERLQRFFVKAGEHHYHINKQLRESVVFAVQNLISDAPFSKLDFISCRNLLIYLEPDAQRKVISLFHFALNDDGFLFLGSSETVGRHGDLFETVSKKWRVFRWIGPTRRDVVDFPIVGGEQQRRLPLEASGPATQETNHIRLTERLLLNRFAPAALLINQKYEILNYSGPTRGYLQDPSGPPTQNLMSKLLDGLRTKVRAAVQKAIRDGELVVVSDARVKRDGKYDRVRITVEPVREPKEGEALLLVVFEDQAEGSRRPQTSGETAESTSGESGFQKESPLLHQLDVELKATQEELQRTIEEMESSHEEMKVSNEEVMSMNEELQSANEELETSKEELQSLNEELSTVNNQLEDKVDELEKTNNDMSNLLANTDVGMVFLDTKLQIKRFTPVIGKLVKLIDTDIGRPLGVFAGNLNDDTLLDDAQKVLDDLIRAEKEVLTDDGQCFLRRVVPYLTQNNRIEGVVITFVDITERVRAETQTRRLATVVLDANDAVTMQTLDGRITAWNRAAERMYGYTEAEALKMNACEIVPEDRRAEALQLTRSIAEGEEVESYQTQRLTKDGRTLDVWLTITKLVDDKGRVMSVATTERDISERLRAEKSLRRAERLVSLGTLAAGLAHELNNPIGAVVNSIQAALNVNHSEADNPKFDEYLRNAFDAAERCSDIVAKLRKFARAPDSSARRFCDLNVVARRAVESARAFAVSEKASLELTTDKNLPQLLINDAEIELLITNLIDNSVQAGEGGAHVTVRTQRTTEGARLTVADDGRGIAEDIRQRAFDPFYSTRYDQGGTGLGLSIAHGIVADHGGSIEIVGEVGKGTTVTVELPIAKQETSKSRVDTDRPTRQKSDEEIQV